LCIVRLAEGYEAFIACGPAVTAYVGRRVALVVDAACKDLLTTCRKHPAAVNAFVATLEALLQRFDETVGRRPTADASALFGRVRVEVAFLDAAGLAHHGVAGIAVGPAFPQGCIEAFASGKPTLHHVFCYEFCRCVVGQVLCWQWP